MLIERQSLAESESRTLGPNGLVKAALDFRLSEACCEIGRPFVQGAASNHRAPCLAKTIIPTR
jgi:hypothetical protein